MRNPRAGASCRPAFVSALRVCDNRAVIALIDSHSHIDTAEFDGDRDDALRRANAVGVTRQIVPAIALSGFAKLRDL